MPFASSYRLLSTADRSELLSSVSLLIDALDKESLGRTILMADFDLQVSSKMEVCVKTQSVCPLTIALHLQYRDVKALGGDAEKLADLWKDEAARADKEKGPTDVHPDGGSSLAQIKAYRQVFARVLVVGSELQNLEGKDRYKFERRREDDLDSDSGGENEEGEQEVEEKGKKTGGPVKRMSTLQKARERSRLMKMMMSTKVDDPSDADNPV